MGQYTCFDLKNLLLQRNNSPIREALQSDVSPECAQSHCQLRHKFLRSHFSETEYVSGVGFPLHNGINSFKRREWVSNNQLSVACFLTEYFSSLFSLFFHELASFCRAWQEKFVVNQAKFHNFSQISKFHDECFQMRLLIFCPHIIENLQ